MRINKTHILFFLTAHIVAVNILVLFNLNFHFLREIISSFFLFIVPGLLLLPALRIKTETASEFILYTVCVSLSLLMLIGLSINYILPIFAITEPLAAIPVLLSMDVLLLLFLYLFYIRSDFSFQIAAKKHTVNIVLMLISLMFPILSILGALSINNNSTNIWTMIMFASVAAYVLLVIYLRNRVTQALYPFALFMISLAILFTVSLRGYSITGHDIYLEYFVFQITKLSNFWSMEHFQSTYTACLSITILPTIIANVTHVSDMYVFKILYQILFSFTIIGAYLFLRRYTTPFIAFLASFAMITFPTFMTDMSMLNRQEIGWLFFITVLLLVFKKNISSKMKWLMFILLGFGLIVSHYSTIYLTIGLFSLTTVTAMILALFRVNPRMKIKTSHFMNKLDINIGKPHMHPGMVLILIFGTFIWYTVFTQTSRGIENTLGNIVHDIQNGNFGKGEGPASYSLLNFKEQDEQELLNGYVENQTNYVRLFNSETAFFNKENTTKFQITPGNQTVLPLTSLGEMLNNNVNVFWISDTMKQIYAKSVQIFIVIGFFALFFYKKHLNKIDEVYILLCIVYLFLIFIQLIFPSRTIDYGILRLVQQGLFLLALPLILGLLAIFGIFNKLVKNINIYLSTLVLLFFFLFLSGFIPQLLGGYYPQLQLTNKGFYYDAYYLHETERKSIEWISKNRNKEFPVQSNWFAGNKIHTFSGFYPIDGIIPSVIRKDSYVYLDYLNTVEGQVTVYIGGIPVYYKYPVKFLDENKDLLYSNGETKIYK